MRKFSEISLVSAIILNLISAPMAHAQEAPTPLKPDILDIGNPQAGTTFLYYNKDLRIQVFSEYIRYLEANYSHFFYKKHILGIDGRKNGMQALEVENSIPDVAPSDTLAQAESNLKFFDRVRKYMASYRDTHMNVSPALPLSNVTMGIHLNKVGQKFLITVRDRPLLLDPKTGLTHSEDIHIGDEVLKIDDESPQDIVNRLKPYIEGSSEEYRELEATAQISARHYLLPTKPTVKIFLKRPDGRLYTFNLNWYAMPTVRSDQALYFESKKIPYLTTSTINVLVLAKALHMPVIDNEANELRIAGLKERVDYTDSLTPNDELILRSGVIERSGKTYGFLQVHSFEVASPRSLLNKAHFSEQEKEFDASTKAKPKKSNWPRWLPSYQHPAKDEDESKPDKAYEAHNYVETLEEIMSDFKKRNLPLILDLRNNMGGDSTYVDALISVLMPKNPEQSFSKGGEATINNGVLATPLQLSTTVAELGRIYRVTPHSRQTIDGVGIGGGEDNMTNVAKKNEYLKVMAKAIQEGKVYTDALPTDPIVVDKKVGGYFQKIVALVSPECISSCEIAVRLLKTFGRATLVGQPTNGTGGGWFETYASMLATDSNHVLAWVAPSTLWGDIKDRKDYPGFSVEADVAENKPTQPDIIHDDTEEDVFAGNPDWINAAVGAFARAPELYTNSIIYKTPR